MEKKKTSIKAAISYWCTYHNFFDDLSPVRRGKNYSQIRNLYTIHT